MYIHRFSQFKFKCREDTLDEYVVNEVIKRGDYEKHFKIEPDDRVLDLGGHIGTLACLASRKAKAVLSVEMDKTNFNLLKQNLKLNNCEDVEILNKAVTLEDDETIEYGQNTMKNTGAHSFFIKGGKRAIKEASTISIDTILEEFAPTFIKMDIEGAEKILLPSILDYHPMKFIMEYHHNIIKNLSHYTKVWRKINKMYDNVVGKKPDQVGKNWHSYVYAWDDF